MRFSDLKETSQVWPPLTPPRSDCFLRAWTTRSLVEKEVCCVPKPQLPQGGSEHWPFLKSATPSCLGGGSFSHEPPCHRFPRAREPHGMCSWQAHRTDVFMAQGRGTELWTLSMYLNSEAKR